jgi:hypothetical protein
MRTHLWNLSAAFASLMLVGMAWADNFIPTKDEKLTEKQVTNYIAARKDI